MAENLTQNQIITIAGRKKMLRARAGEIQLPKIVGFVFGDGGVDAAVLPAKCQQLFRADRVRPDLQQHVYPAGASVLCQ